MSIIHNSRFSIPLYHGTTSAFIESIKADGLGAVDPLKEMKAKSALIITLLLLQNVISQIVSRDNKNYYTPDSRSIDMLVAQK